MTITQQAIVMTFGALIAVVGLALHFYRTEEGKNRIKVFGQEFEVSTPGVLVFLVGCGIFVMPFVLPLERRREDGPPIAPITVGPTNPSPPPAGEGHAKSSSSPPAPAAGTPAKSTDLFLSEEKEPNDQITEANLIELGTRIRGSVSSAQDRDFFKFRTPAGTPRRIRVLLRKLTSTGFWAEVSVYDHAERHITKSEQMDDRPVSLAFESTPNSLYYIVVKSDSLQPRGPYEIEVRVD